MNLNIRKVLPFLNWGPLTKETVKADLWAGLTVALCLIPQSMAYSELAGLPAWVGLYGSFLPVIIGALWGSSNHLQTGPVAMVSLLTATTLAPLTILHPANYLAAASLLAIIVGIAWLFIGFFKLTFVVNFLSKPVIEGFVNAAALIIASSQLHKLFGLSEGAGGSYLAKLWDTISSLVDLHIETTVIGISALIGILLLKKYLPKAPGQLVVVVLSTLVVYLLNKLGYGKSIAVVGLIPTQIPRPQFMLPDADTLLILLEGAGVIVFIGFLEMCSITKAIAAQSKDKINLNQEVIGQGLASIAAGLTGGYTPSGSISRTALNFSSGAKTALSAVFTGLFVLVTLLFFTDLLFYLPKAVLAALIVSAVIRIFKPKVFLEFWTINKMDGIILSLTFVGTLAFAPHLERGIIIGAVLSLVFYVYRTMKYYAGIISELHKGDISQIAEDDEMPIIHLGGRLFFGNTSYIEDTMLDVVNRCKQAKHICIDCSNINEIDISVVSLFEKLVTNLGKSGVSLLFAHVRPNILDIIKKSGLYDVIGENNIYDTVWDAREEINPECTSGNYYII